MAKPSKPNREMSRLLSVVQQQLPVIQSISTLHSGPLPDPATLAGYNNVTPGLAERIVRMAETEAAHRREIEVAIIHIESDEHQHRRRIEGRGQLCALAVAMAALIGGVVCIIADHAISGSLLTGGTVVSLVSLFIYGQKRQKKQDASDKKAIVTAKDIT